MRSLLCSILAFAVTASQACLTIHGSCQLGTNFPYVSIHVDDNNGQATCDTDCDQIHHCGMRCSGNVNDAWVEDCTKLHYNTNHGNFVLDMHPSVTTTCNRQCGIVTGCCDFEFQYLVDTRALC
ncbi:hypothetical protein V8C37DRAFT_397486 [Trichoderma ceciliae]